MKWRYVPIKMYVPIGYEVDIPYDLQVFILVYTFN